MVNIRTRVATVNNNFSSSRIANLNERKNCSTQHYHCTLSELKTQVLTLSDDLTCVLLHCADQKQHSNPFSLRKIC